MPSPVFEVLQFVSWKEVEVVEWVFLCTSWEFWEFLF